MPSSASPSVLNLLRDRQQYQHCHLLIADEENPSAGLQVDGEYYVFFRVVNDLTRGIQLIERLAKGKNKTVVTMIPKGYAIWVHEPSACLHSRRVPQDRSVSGGRGAVSPPKVAPFEQLTSERDYSPCKIQVPDLDKPLTGIQYRSNLYSLLRIVRDESQAINLAQRLYQKGNQALISSTAYGYSIWVLEPDGTTV